MERINSQTRAMFGAELEKLDAAPKLKAPAPNGGAHYVATATLTDYTGERYIVRKHWCFSQACIDESGIARTGNRADLDWKGHRPDTNIAIDYDPE